MTLSVTRADLKDFAIRSVGGGAIGSVPIDRIEECIEDALDMIAQERRFTFMQETYDIITTPDVTFTSTLSVTHNTPTVTDSGSGIPDTVGAFYELNGERHWYEMTARASAASSTIRQAYTNESASNLSSVSGKLLYPLNNLPGNFNKITGLLDCSNAEPLVEMAYDAAWLSKLERIGQGTPEAFGIVPKRNDPNQWQLYLWPAPDTKKRYVMTYFRLPGWYDTATPATSTWYRRAPSGTSGDTYYVDWPDKLMYVLKAAVMAAVAKEIAPTRYDQLVRDFYLQVSKAASFDKKSSKPMRLSMGNTGLAGSRYDF